MMFHSISGSVSDAPLVQSIALEESPVPGLLHAAITVIGCLLAAFMVWATFATVEEVASAAGQVVPSGYIQNIQHLDGGIIREIYVQEGDLVKKGQRLVRLDATDANADLGQMMARQAGLQSQATRLRQFSNGQRATNSPHALTAEEQAILTSMEEARTNQRNVLRDQIVQKQKEMTAIAAMRQALQRSVRLKEEENRMMQDSVANGSTSRMMALASERELSDLQGRLSEIVNQERSAPDAIREAKSRLGALDADLRQEAMKQLGQVEAELAELNKSIGRQEGAADRTLLISPVDGVVKGLTIHTLGAVVNSGEVLMEVVPVNEELLVEALVSPNDIGNVHAGQKAEIKVSAFDFSRYGSVPGVLKNVSASTFQDKDGQSFYKVRISLDRHYVGRQDQRNLILPGMTVQANIITGDKTVLQYLLKPIRNATDGAFHER